MIGLTSRLSCRLEQSRLTLPPKLSNNLIHLTPNMSQIDPQGKPFPTLINDCIIKAAKGEKTEFVPVWIMRQAGRYLAEFRELRLKHSFFEICKNPELACEVTLQPIRRFNLDAAIIFSDILVIPQALGFNIEMNDGLIWDRLLDINRPIAEQINVEGAISRISYVFDAITMTRHALEGKVPLFGFSGGPFTLLAYMIAGSGGKIALVREWIYKASDQVQELMAILTQLVIDYMVGQAKAGAQLLQLFESCGDHMTPDLFKELVYPAAVKVANEVKRQVKELGFDHVPFGYFVRAAPLSLKQLNDPDNGIDVVGVDWATDPEFARQQTSKTVQGNLDPWLMIGSKDQVRSLTEKMVKTFGTQKYIANFGHGITPQAKTENVEVFIETVHAVSREMNKS